MESLPVRLKKGLRRFFRKLELFRVPVGALRAFVFGISGAIVALLSLGVHLLQKRPELEVWHKARLNEEFTRHSKVRDFEEYLELEDQLYAELEEKVYQKTGTATLDSISRYQHGSGVDPTRGNPDGNRTFVLSPTAPTCGVLLIHGLSDSPYSLRHIGERMYEEGAMVIGLRVPGHGTAPSGLVRTSWKDMAAAVDLAVNHLQETLGNGKPVYLIGYSNGAALAVEHAIRCVESPPKRQVDGLVLISAEIGLSPAAGFAAWQGRIGFMLGLKKLAWNSISLEYDPYKYRSFAINAAHQANLITTTIDKRLERLSDKGALDGFPKVLAYQSAVDATVLPSALVTRLFSRLSHPENELVVYDINRTVHVEHILSRDPAGEFDWLLDHAGGNFNLSILTNKTDENGRRSEEAVFLDRNIDDKALQTRSTGLKWPSEVYSLSHIALPFPENDPVYGSGSDSESRTLGNLALRGERGAILIPAEDMLRQRWNPFYDLMENRIVNFCEIKNSD